MAVSGRARVDEPVRLEIAWTEADRTVIWLNALRASPREGATIGLCRRSTGASRTTFIVQHPLPPEPGDLSYHRGLVVTVTARYWNRAIDELQEQPAGTGLAVLHTHPGSGVPEWSSDDNRADDELARFLCGESFLGPGTPLVSMVGSSSHVRARVLSYDGRVVSARSITRLRSMSLSHFEARRTADHAGKIIDVPSWADRSVRVFGKDGQRLLADLHVASVGAGGVGSIVAEHLARLGMGAVTLWDPDVVEDVNVNRSAVITYSDVGSMKAETVAHALPRFSLVRGMAVRAWNRDVRLHPELPRLLDADLIVMLVDDARARNFINRVAYAHYIPVLDAGNAISSSAEDDASEEVATVEEGGVRVNVMVPGGPCLWCTRQLTSKKLSLAYRSPDEVAAERARGYVENLGPEHAPSVMPVNVLTAALLEMRLQDLLYRLSGREVPETYYSMLAGTLDELPRQRLEGCRHCVRWEGLGDVADLEFADA